MTYCKPHLHNLPVSTAFELQTVRERLETSDLPPYRPIQDDALPAPTVPTFATTLQQQAQRTAGTRPTLRPRAQWMRDTPPFLADEQADSTYAAACSWMFGTREPPSRHEARLADITDLRHPDNPYHADGQKLRGRIGLVLKHRDHIKHQRVQS